MPHFYDEAKSAEEETISIFDSVAAYKLLIFCDFVLHFVVNSTAVRVEFVDLAALFVKELKVVDIRVV